MAVHGRGANYSLQDCKTGSHILLQREAIRAILTNQISRDDRLLVFVGPCSVHSIDATLHYARLLAQATQVLSTELLIVMRVYIEKPRTTVGWKGLVHDPELRQSSPNGSIGAQDLVNGLIRSRELMLEVTKLGLPIVTEVLTPLVVPFIDDLLACGVIGARTTESQTHRELVSGLDMPIGFKNGTDGSLDVAVHAMAASSVPHTVLTVNYRGQMVQQCTSGNDSTFVILRGGRNGPNYSADHIRKASAAVVSTGRGSSGVVVDCSHGNSEKDYRNQSRVAAAVAVQVAQGAPVVGLMIESNIHEGRQDACGPATLDKLKYGVSITDGCVGWHETESVLRMLAVAVRERRQIRGCSTSSA